MIIHTKIISRQRYQAPKVEVIECDLTHCPLRDNGQCVCPRNSCPYGKVSYARPQDSKYEEWLRLVQDICEPNGQLQAAPARLRFIGDYVYIPYDLKFDGSEFTQESFQPISRWTLENLKRLTSSATDFLIDLYQLDNEMYRQLVETRPDLQIEPNFINRHAYITTLNPDITIEDGYLNLWYWDGEELSSVKLRDSVSYWIPKNYHIDVTIVPMGSEVVKIKDNSWVGLQTEFKD